jgi:SAM-dependent methyltransferase
LSDDSVTRFSDRAADYVRYRPGYPPAAIDAILDGLAAPNLLVAADIGAGTGISARLLGERGVCVIAVEPGEAMRAAAAPHEKVRWIGGRAEATGLSSASVDLVLCAQSFHWFHPPDALAEFARVLKPGRRLAIMWNRRSQTDPFTAGYRRAILDVGGEIAAERMPFDPDVVARSGQFFPPDRLAFPNDQRLDLAGLIGRARSASYVPKSGPDAERLLELLRRLHARHADADGCVTLVYETEVFRAAARP